MTSLFAVPAYPQIGKREYMQRFEPFFSARQMRLLRAAYAFSKEGHRMQKRDDGQRYFDHVRACSWIAIDELHLHDSELHNTLLLHDIVEDTFLLTVESIEEFFGENTAIMVNLLTHRKGTTTADYVRNLRESARARVIGAKLIDRLHNLRSLDVYGHKKRVKKVEETQEFYLPMAEQLIENVSPAYRWRALYLRDHIAGLCQHWLNATS